MPKLETVILEIRTGAQGGPERPTYSINGFSLDFDEYRGRADAGQSLTVTGHPRSFPHTLLLEGPGDGTWDIESVQATYICTGLEPYTVALGAVTLDEDSDLNIWYDKPAQLFDV